MRIVCVMLLAAGIVAGCGPTAAETMSADHTIASGSNGRLASAEDDEARRDPWIEVALSRDELATLWTRHLPGSPADAPRGRLDFGREAAAFLLLGLRPTGGFAIEPAAVTVDGKTVRIRTRLIEPSPDGFVTMALTAPYAVVRVPAKDFDTVEWLDEGGTIVATWRK